MSQPSGAAKNPSALPRSREVASQMCLPVKKRLMPLTLEVVRVRVTTDLIHSTNSPEMHDLDLCYTYQGGLSRQRWPSRCDFLGNDALHSEDDRARATALRPSDTAWLNSSPGSRKRTAASICRNGTPRSDLPSCKGISCLHSMPCMFVVPALLCRDTHTVLKQILSSIIRLLHRMPALTVCACPTPPQHYPEVLGMKSHHNKERRVRRLTCEHTGDAQSCLTA